MLKARANAQQADILIVNHALLISDMTAENNILPPHQVLVIDEAHHLRDVATRHLGFEIRESQVMDDLSALTRSDGMLPRLIRLRYDAWRWRGSVVVGAGFAEAGH